MIDFLFFTVAGGGLFVRNDIEEGHWVQEEMSLTATFPYNSEKVIERGQRVAFNDPATGNLEVFEIRKVSTIEPEQYQQITAEHIVISELSDEHINTLEIEDKTPQQALTTILTGTLWTVGNVSATNVSTANVSRGSVWQGVNTICQNWNVYIIPRITVTGSGTISARYLDIIPAGGTFRGIRLSIDKNLSDSVVEYNDTEVLTALYGYGGNIDVAQSGGQQDKSEELTFASSVWTATSDHPAKPSGQTYLEWPEKTAIYGRNGRPRYGYYQNGDIKDPDILLQKTWEALKKTADPKICISGTVIDLYRLGYADQPMRLHDTAIVEIPETGELFYKEIIRLDVDLVDPTATRPEIGDYVPNIIYINRETNKKASGGGGGGGRGSTNLEDENQKFFTDWIKDHDKIGMVVGTYNGGYKIEAGRICLAINDQGSNAYINADHVNISGTNTVHALAGDVAYDESTGRLVIKSAGGMYVQRTESGTTAQFGVFDDGNLTSGIIVTKINGKTSTKIEADYIDIDGILNAIGIISKTVRIGTLSVFTQFDSTHILDSSSGLFITGNSFTFNHYLVSWQSDTVVTSVTRSGSSHRFRMSDDSVWEHYVVTDVTVTDKTINYLGR